MELTNLVREGVLEPLEQWFEDHPEPASDEVTMGGVSVAHWAASGESAEVLKYIITKFPELINQQNNEDGATPLHWAAQDNREKNVSLLLDRGAKSVTDHMGETPLHLAAMNGFLGCVQLLTSSDVVNLGSVEGNTPLHLATLNANKRIVAYLLSQGADPDLENHKKQTSRGIAAAKKDKQLLDYFDPEKLRILEEIEKAQDINEELQGQNADLKNIVDAEIRKREAAYTVIKLDEDKIAALEAKVNALTAELEESKRTQASQNELIETLNAKLADAESKVSSLQESLNSAQSQSPTPITAKDFPSELIYAQVKQTQSQLQKLCRFLEDSEQAILITKTSLNQLEESLGQ
jgi:ankyrin repeat protein